jgi:hypothetical protein
MFDDASLRSYVINAVADDYESLEIIERVALEFAATDGITIDIGEIPGVLHTLVADGLIQSYRFRPPGNDAEAVAFALNDVQELWFYITPEGKRQLLS